MRNEALEKIGKMPGVTAVSVTHDSGLDWDPEMIAPQAQARRKQRLDSSTASTREAKHFFL